MVFEFFCCYASQRIIKAYDDYLVENRSEAVRKKSYFPFVLSLSNILSLWIYQKFYEQSVSTHLMPFVSHPQLGFFSFFPPSQRRNCYFTKKRIQEKQVHFFFYTKKVFLFISCRGGFVTQLKENFD